MIDTVIFDLDGTLLDTLTDLHLSVNHALSRLSFPERSREEIRTFVGNGAQKLIERAAPAGCDDETLSHLLSLFNEHYALHALDHTAPYDGILPLIDNLQKEGFSMAVVSNKPDFATEALCKRFFGTALSPTIGQRKDLKRKPDPHMIFEAMRLLKRDARSCIYVGDSEVDVEAAKNAGLPCLCVCWGFRSAAQLKEAGADRIASNPEALFDQLLTMHSERTI